MPKYNYTITPLFMFGFSFFSAYDTFFGVCSEAHYTTMDIYLIDHHVTEKYHLTEKYHVTYHWNDVMNESLKCNILLIGDLISGTLLRNNERLYDIIKVHLY